VCDGTRAFPITTGHECYICSRTLIRLMIPTHDRFRVSVGDFPVVYLRRICGPRDTSQAAGGFVVSGMVCRMMAVARTLGLGVATGRHGSFAWVGRRGDACLTACGRRGERH
jgi:hypothetical protein